MSGMRPNSKASRCLRVFEDGPGTIADVVVETGLSPHNAGSHVFNLVQRGYLRKAESSTRGPLGYMSRYIYFLPSQQCAPHQGGAS